MTPQSLDEKLEQFESDNQEFVMAVIKGRADIDMACKLMDAAKRLITEPATTEKPESDMATDLNPDQDKEPEPNQPSPESRQESAPIESLDISETIIEKLKDPGNGPSIKTVSELKEFIESGQSLSESINGIGPKTESEIKSQLDV